MTLTERKIWHLPLLLLLALWLGGCSMHEDIEEIDTSSDFFLLLNIHSGDSNFGLTRANELGVSFEAASGGRELMNTLRVIIVNRDTKVVAHNDYILLPEASAFKDGLKYKVDLDTEYRVYLIANEDGIPNLGTLLSDINEGEVYTEKVLEDKVIGSVDVGQPIISDLQKNVPMTEFFDITTSAQRSTKEGEEIIQNETFFITRAASKFSFYFFVADDFGELTSEEDAQWEIKSVKIGGLGKDEYLFPNGTVYQPTKESNKTAVNRDITDFNIPSEGNGVGDYIFELPTERFKLSELPKKPANFNINNPSAGLTNEQIRKFVPEIYFPESKGDASGNLDCTISFDGVKFLPKVTLPNLPYNLPRNTHVVVVITLHEQSLEASVAIQPFAEQKLTFQFGLMRDERGDLKVLFDKNGALPDYFKSFVSNHKDEYRIGQISRTDDNGVTQQYWVLYEGSDDNTGIILENGDYFAIVVGEYENLNEARIWIKDSDGCHVLSNYENTGGYINRFGAREVEEFFGLNQSERYMKDALGYRQEYLFLDYGDVSTHNSIVIHPETSMMLFRANPETITINDEEGNPISNTEMMYFRVENWVAPDEGVSAKTVCGHIIVSEKTSNDNKYVIAVFREILADGTLGEYSDEVVVPVV